MGETNLLKWREDQQLERMLEKRYVCRLGGEEEEDKEEEGRKDERRRKKVGGALNRPRLGFISIAGNYFTKAI